MVVVCFTVIFLCSNGLMEFRLHLKMHAQIPALMRTDEPLRIVICTSNIAGSANVASSMTLVSTCGSLSWHGTMRILKTKTQLADLEHQHTCCESREPLDLHSVGCWPVGKGLKLLSALPRPPSLDNNYSVTNHLTGASLLTRWARRKSQPRWDRWYARHL